MKRIIALILLAATSGLFAQTAPDAAELTKLLREFLAGAGRNDAEMHDRFWAEDLIYTGSGGRRRGKEELMRDVRTAPSPEANEPTTIYTAEEVRIQQYGETAIVAFRLVATTEKDGTTSVRNFFNTGTFLKRAGKWQAAGWQATALPRPEDEARKQVAAAESALHQALLAGDGKKLEALTDETFVWTDETAAPKTRGQVLELCEAKGLKYSKPETKDVVVTIYGDSAIVRGAASYMLTFISKDGDWKAVALHSPRRFVDAQK